MTNSEDTSTTLFTDVDARQGLVLPTVARRGQRVASICAATPIIIDGLRHMLEVGCGTGDDAEALARLVNNGGDVVGVDLSETMINEAAYLLEAPAVTAWWRALTEAEANRAGRAGWPANGTSAIPCQGV